MNPTNEVLAKAQSCLEWFDSETSEGVFPPYPIEVYELIVDLCAVIAADKIKSNYETASIDAVFNKLLGNPNLNALTIKGAIK